MCSVLSQASKKLDSIDIDNGKNNLNKLSHTSELSLLKLLEIYPEIILKSTKDYAPHNLSSYLKDLASAIHSWYAIGSKNKKQQVLIDEKNLRDARLCLVEATRQVISNGLNLLGISAPKKCNGKVVVKRKIITVTRQQQPNDISNFRFGFTLVVYFYFHW